VWRLHHSVDGVLTATRREISLAPHVGVDTEELDEHFRRLRDGCPPDQAVAVVDFSVGGLLPGWSDEWVVVDRERVRQVHLRTLTMLSRAFAAAGDLDRAVLTAYRAAQVDPLRESTHRLLLELHIAAGDYAEALRRHEEFRRTLYAELGILPSPHARMILERIPTEAPPVPSRGGRDAPMTASAHDAPDLGSRRARLESRSDEHPRASH
jgi:DNA-binding SARP family transcriptional activator